jgi:DNA polymerase-3 subunit gamma/tau
VPATAEPAAAGGLDATALRRSWDAVLDAAGKESRKTQALLRSAQVLALTGKALTVGFPSGQLVRMFEEGTNTAVLKSALQSLLGLEVDLSLVVGTQAPAAAESPTAPAPAVPAYEGLAPGDEIEPVDPEAPAPERPVHGEDAALALLQDQLGGRVINES